MGDERRDFDTSGRTNGQHDQTEPVPPQDDTQAGSPAQPPDETQPFTPPDETQPFTPPDETQPFTPPDETRPMAAPDETQPFAAPDQTQPYSPPREPDETTLLPEDFAGGRAQDRAEDRVWSGRAGVVPPPGPSLRDSAPYSREVPQGEQPRPWWTPLLLGLLALGLLGVLILVAYLMGRDNTPAPVDSPTASAVEATTPTETALPTAPASPTAQIVQIPRLVGLPLDDAVAQLDQLGLAYRFEYRQADEPQGTVIEASPPEGTVVPIQATVTLTISTGRNSPPPPSPSPSRPLASATPTQ